MTLAVEFVNKMGDDLSVVNAAKASFGRADDVFKPKEHGRLINFLAKGLTSKEINEMVNEVTSTDDPDLVWARLKEYRNTATHFTPFCHAQISLRFKAPIAIHAQCSKHQVGMSMNTVSRRYISERPELFVPTFRHAPDGSIKQGSGDDIERIFTVEYTDGQLFNFKTDAERSSFVEQFAKDNPGVDVYQLLETDKDALSERYETVCQDAIALYDEFISLGVAPEQARFMLPQGVITEWVWTGSLMAWANFYKQRSNAHAQKEIQELAKLVADIVEPLFPVSWSALTS